MLKGSILTVLGLKIEVYVALSPISDMYVMFTCCIGNRKHKKANTICLLD